MRINNVKAKNFGSYKEVEYGANDSGLTCISGPTGSGKSTLFDAVLWCLFGTTAKGTNVGDVCSWEAQDEKTECDVSLDIRDNAYRVHRSRRGNVSDFFFERLDATGVLIRGRSVVETQELLSQRLGCDADAFVSGSYFCEQSSSHGFFLANAKERRKVLDLVTDLSTPSVLVERITANRKRLTVEQRGAGNNLQRHAAASDALQLSLSSAQRQWRSWESDSKQQQALRDHAGHDWLVQVASRLAALETKREAWDAQHVATLDECIVKLGLLQERYDKAEAKAVPCPTCGVSKGAVEVAELQGKIDLLCDKYQTTGAMENPYEAEIERVKQEKPPAPLPITTNPHTKYVKDLEGRLSKLKAELTEAQAQLDALNAELSSLDQLNDLTFLLRGVLLQSSVQRLETKTNLYLETHFDSEFRVAFDASDGDSIEVSITKGGYACTFRQLSKGQRQLLRLCFAISVMEATADASGVNYETLFLDEPLDGMDESLKLKAFSLLETLAQNHSAVFVIDHTPAFQDLFANRWSVEMTGDGSVLNC